MRRRVAEPSVIRAGRPSSGPPGLAESVFVFVFGVGEEVLPTDVAGDLREVLGGLRHRRAEVEAAPDTGILDVGDEIAQTLVRPRRPGDGAGDDELHTLRLKVVAERLGQG